MGENLKIASLHHSLCLASDQIIAEVLLQQKFKSTRNANISTYKIKNLPICKLELPRIFILHYSLASKSYLYLTLDIKNIEEIIFSGLSTKLNQYELNYANSKWNKLPWCCSVDASVNSAKICIFEVWEFPRVILTLLNCLKDRMHYRNKNTCSFCK